MSTGGDYVLTDNDVNRGVIRMRRGSWEQHRPASRLLASVMLILQNIGNQKVQFRVVANGITLIQNFMKIRLVILLLANAFKRISRVLTEAVSSPG
jgi:hypothetical protein